MGALTDNILDRRYLVPALGMLLVIMTSVVFLQVRHHDFVEIDDRDYVVDNPAVRSGLNPASVKWALSTTHVGNWHPVTWLSHMLDVQLFGLDAGAHHLVNVVIHALNAVLLFLVLTGMTGAPWRSWAAAALFAVHPLHVESVAWVAERKDLLSAFFALVSLAIYMRYVKRPGAALYVCLVFVFALGLMSKPMIVTLPFLMLLLDYWPLQRWPAASGTQGAGRLVLEKIPLFTLSALSAAITYLAVGGKGGMTAGSVVPVQQRIANSLVSYIGYVGKTVWPAGLAVFYPFPLKGIPWVKTAAAALTITAVTAAVLWYARRHRHLAVGWLWFLGTMVPVIGLVQVGGHSMADRYTYIPVIGLFIMVVWSVPVRARLPQGAAGFLAVCSLGLLLTVAGAAWKQTGYWRDSVTLFARALDVTRENFLAHAGMGAALERKGRRDEAMAHFQEALRIHPDFVPARNSLGKNLARSGRLREAEVQFSAALRAEPDHAVLNANMGSVLSLQGRHGEAVRHYRKAISINPDYAEAYYHLALAESAMGRKREASGHLREALRIRPDYADAHSSLGVIFAKEGLFKEALEEYAKALRIDPNHADASYNMAVDLIALGRKREAVSYLQKVLRIQPDHRKAREQLRKVYGRQ